MGNQTSGYLYPEEIIENKARDLIVTSLPEKENTPTMPLITTNNGVENPKTDINDNKFPVYIKTCREDLSTVKHVFESDKEDIINHRRGILSCDAVVWSRAACAGAAACSQERTTFTAARDGGWSRGCVHCGGCCILRSRPRGAYALRAPSLCPN